MQTQPDDQIPTPHGERGAGLIEYALLLAMIAVVCFSAVTFFGTSSGAGFGKSKDCIEAAYDGAARPAKC